MKTLSVYITVTCIVQIKWYRLCGRRAVVRSAFSRSAWIPQTTAD